MFKRTAYIFILFLFISSCADTFSSVKRGLTGAKANSADEFMVKKKDPLILPPDYDSLPTPDESGIETEEFSTFEKTLNKESLTEADESTAGSSEMSILQQIRNK